MIVECTNKKSGNTVEITEIIESITWSGSTSQVARTCELSLLNAPDDPNMAQLGIAIASGDIIRMRNSTAVIFYGEIHTVEKSSDTGTVTYSCYDLLAHFLRSTEIANYSNTTAEDIARELCAKFQIETGAIAETKAPINKMIIDGDTIYDIIMKAYTKAAKQTGQLYICRMNEAKFSVEVKGTKIEGFVLAEEYNISNASYQETIENMINRVKIYDEKGNQIGEVNNEEWVQNFGIYQQTYKKETGVNETTAATGMLNGIEKMVSLTGIDADLTCIAGNGVEVFDKATGLTGLFWIESDSHVWENGTHTTDLELSYQNIMDSKDHDEQ